MCSTTGGWESPSSWEVGTSLVMVGHVSEPFGVVRGVSIDGSVPWDFPARSWKVVGKGMGRVVGGDIRNLLGVGVTGIGVLSVLFWTVRELEACCERSTYPTSRNGRCCCRSGMITGSVDLRSSGFDLLEVPPVVPWSWSISSNDARKGFAESLWL